MDLAKGHLDAFNLLQNITGVQIWNLGTGKGFSVLDVLRIFKDISGISLPYCFAPRRKGDVAVCYANPFKAEQELGWKAARGLSEMLSDAWRWQLMNPHGYQ